MRITIIGRELGGGEEAGSLQGVAQTSSSQDRKCQYFVM